MLAFLASKEFFAWNRPQIREMRETNEKIVSTKFSLMAVQLLHTKWRVFFVYTVTLQWSGAVCNNKRIHTFIELLSWIKWFCALWYLFWINIQISGQIPIITMLHCCNKHQALNCVAKSALGTISMQRLAITRWRGIRSRWNEQMHVIEKPKWN